MYRYVRTDGRQRRTVLRIAPRVELPSARAHTHTHARISLRTRCRLAEWIVYSEILPLSDDIFEEVLAQAHAKLLALRPPRAAEHVSDTRAKTTRWRRRTIGYPPRSRWRAAVMVNFSTTIRGVA